MTKEIIVSPSILSCDFANLESDIKKVEPYVKWLHIDVMDGHFVPNITIGAPVVRCIRKVTNLFLDVHLMIENPIKYIDDFALSGADLITFHLEAVKKPIEVIEKIKSKNIKAGISIKPNTDANDVLAYLDMVDVVLVMTVEPGFGGQKFIEHCKDKILFLRKNNENVIIQVDGGINDKTAKICFDMGADCFVCGSYIFNSGNIKQSIELLYNC